MTAFLDFLARYESVQLLIILCLGAMGLAAVVGYNWRKSITVKDRAEENTLRRKMEWQNFNDRKAIESKVNAVTGDDDGEV